MQPGYLFWLSINQKGNFQLPKQELADMLPADLILWISLVSSL